MKQCRILAPTQEVVDKIEKKFGKSGRGDWLDFKENSIIVIGSTNNNCGFYGETDFPYRASYPLKSLKACGVEVPSKKQYLSLNKC